MRTIKQLLRYIILFAFDIILLIPSFIQIHLLRAHRQHHILHNTIPDATEQKDIAIISVYQKQGLSPSTRRLINAFQHHGIIIIIVSNSAILEQDLDFLKKNTHTVIHRKNLGRDFGAYQCGWQFITKQRLPIRKLFMANDSVYYLSGIEKVVAKCQHSKADLVAATENYQHHYHLASYFLVFSEAAHANSCFTDFWEKFLPYSSRKHTINKGEVKLSKIVMRKAGLIPEVIFTTTLLRTKMEEHEFTNLLSDLLYLAPSDFQNILLDLATNIYNSRLPENTDYLKTIFLNSLFSFAENASPSHKLGLLFVKYLDAPIVKRDLCERAGYFISTVVSFMAHYTDEAEHNDLETDLRFKGLPVSRRGLKKFLFDHGRI